ncbi:MAG: CPBP family intramembrane metalloprotease [Bacillota bacterium]|nr:CPBP family intramembrane metalloprotease [Bacillota bacterium]
MIIILAVSFMPVSSLISTISNLIFPNPIMQSAIKNASTGNILWFALIVTALQPAIFEELSFRGIVASSFEEYPTKIAAIMSGMYFGFFHLNFNQFFYASAVGIVMFYLLYYTKSIFASMIFHFTNNGISALLGHILTSQKSTETTGNVSAISYILGFAFILAIFVPIFIAVFRAFVSYNKKHNMPSETISYTLNDTNLETDLDSIKKQKILTPTFFIVSGIFIAFASFIQIYYNIIIRR